MNYIIYNSTRATARFVAYIMKMFQILIWDMQCGSSVVNIKDIGFPNLTLSFLPIIFSKCLVRNPSHLEKMIATRNLLAEKITVLYLNHHYCCNSVYPVQFKYNSVKSTPLQLVGESIYCNASINVIPLLL